MAESETKSGMVVTVKYQLSMYFTTEEMVCPCGCSFGSVVEDMNEELLLVINTIRSIRKLPMIITSAARCEDYNHLIGGAPRSAHLPDGNSQFRAVDIFIQTSSQRAEYVDLAWRLGIRRMFMGENYLHIDVAKDLPHPVIGVSRSMIDD